MHPEPKKMIVRIFFWGALITIPVFFVQIGLKNLLDYEKLYISPSISSIIYWFLIIALSEEFFKYLVIRMKVINSPHLDEPLDIMLYMTVAALGFAAVENVLYLVSAIGQPFDTTLAIYLVRFIGAVFLHTLCSAVVGYSLAISFCEIKNKYLFATIGIIAAVVLHGAFDYSMITLSKPANIAVPIVIILVLALLVYYGFERLKKMKSICKIN
jgi:RsiW-degrading membrane proteinase PrsW (M82 family)